MDNDYRKSKEFFNKQIIASVVYKETYVASSLIDNIIVAMLSVEVLAGMGFITNFIAILSSLDTLHFNASQLYLSKEIGKKDKKNLTQFINRLIVLIIGSIIIRLGILFFIKDIFILLGFNTLVSNDVYEQFVIYTIICSLGLSISDAANCYFRYLNKIGHTSSKIKSAMFDIIPNIVLSILLAPKYQIIGVGIGTLVGKICRASYALFILYTRRHNEEYIEHKYLFRSFEWRKALDRSPTVVSNGFTALADYFCNTAISLFVMNIGLGYAALLNLLILLRKFIKPIPASISEAFSTLYGYHKGKKDLYIIPRLYKEARSYILVTSLIQSLVYFAFIFIIIPNYIAKEKYEISLSVSLIILAIYSVKALSDLFMSLYYDIAGVNSKIIWSNATFITFNILTVLAINLNMFKGTMLDVAIIEIGYIFVNTIPLVLLHKLYFINYLKDKGVWNKYQYGGLINDK